LVRAALRQHRRLIDRIALQRAGQRASHGDALRDFREVEEAQLDLTLKTKDMDSLARSHSLIDASWTKAR